MKIITFPKKTIAFLTGLLLIAFALITTLTSCKNVVETDDDNTVKTITVFSWKDYIDEGYDDPTDEEEGTNPYFLEDVDLDDPYYAQYFGEKKMTKSIVDIFMEENPDIVVNYRAFATNEEMYNELLKDPYGVDLICPSEYMIMKMRDEQLIIPYEMPQNYSDNVSPYIREVFDKLGLNNADGTTYATGYMWGTMGLIYNAERSDISDEDFVHWSNLFDPKFDGKITIKDSLRDSYILAVAMVYEQELLELKQAFENGTITEAEYSDSLFDIFNDTIQETVDKVGEKLTELKSHLYEFEVDGGKNALLTGKIDVNFAWSGDAVFSMWEGDKFGKELRYVVPEEGSNVWFDGWVMTKNADKESSLRFLNFLNDPRIAIRNMDYVGYTSCVGGDEVFEYVKYNFDEEDGINEVDLKYFFNPNETSKKYVVKTSETNRHLYAQYADEETILRCAVMDNFDNESLGRVNAMWSNVKLITFPVYAIVLISVGLVVAIVGAYVYMHREKLFGTRISNKDRKIKKGLKVIKKENII